MNTYLKRVIREALRKRGYLLAKYPSAAFTPISVFDLAVQCLMASKGQNCTFVEVGANNGRYGDPIFRYAQQLPWHGILVEPQPDVFSRLRNTYIGAADRLIFENVAISKNLTELVMYRARKGAASDEVYSSSVVSTNPSLVAAQLNISVSQLEPITVPCMSLNALLEKHGWSHFDILMVDTEGNDLEVLESLDLGRFKPLIIQFEHGHLPPQKLDRAMAYLSQSDYQILYGGYQIDTLAVHSSFKESLENVTPGAQSRAACHLVETC